MATTLISFRPGGLIDDLEARHDTEALSIGAKRDLGRYYRLLEAEFRELDLSDPEAAFLCEVVDPNGFESKPGSFTYLWAHVDDVVRRRRLSSPEVDTLALIEKLRALSAAASLALIDAIERFWRSPTQGPGKPALEFAGYLPGEAARSPK